MDLSAPPSERPERWALRDFGYDDMTFGIPNIFEVASRPYPSSPRLAAGAIMVRKIREIERI